MKTGHKKQLYIIIAVTAFLISLLSVPSTQALNFSSSDNSLNYLIVTGTPDLAKPGDTISVIITGKLAVASNASDTFQITFIVDTASQPAKTITNGNLVLPGDATEATSSFSIAIPTDTITNTYLYMTMRDDSRTYSKIPITLIQNPTYLELQTQNNDLQSSNNTLSILMYIAIFVAVIFIITTVYILSLTFKAKKNKNQNPNTPVQPKPITTESP